MEDKVQPRLDQWNDFAGKFLKADMIKAFPVTLVCANVEGYFDEEDVGHLILTLDFEGKKKQWEINKTNQKIIKDLKIASPKALELKKITFGKVKVRNPSTQQMVDSLVIEKIE